ncbi:Serine/threonine-protein kinase PLK [Aphelenchoides besseyi]|nr:Serine/threonine-protein kinase PLK [Aphelenchoides besseyi]
MSSSQAELKEVPNIVNGKHDGHMVAFERGRFLGKGGFARCYELIDKMKKRTYAAKVISKTILVKKTQREKVMQEVLIHTPLKHPNVVRLYGHFEDADNVYVLLELCARRSLMELHKRRRTITEPEARYFTHQIVAGCQYLHNLKIIHRDLKLGNLFLNDDMILKIGDFGLATNVGNKGEKKHMLCGTPNYIAPEMLLKTGYTYSADVWAIGCILYTLLVGKPPFETESLKQTYAKIRRNEYVIPTRIGQHAHEMIAALLTAEPENRPSVFVIPKYKFFTRGFMPDALPVSCLVSAPHFNHEKVSVGMIEPDNRLGNVLQPVAGTRQEEAVQDAASMIAQNRNGNENNEIPIIEYLNKMAIQLSPFFKQLGEPTQNYELSVHDEHPSSAPVFWITKWIDHSEKYGLSYQLSNNVVGCNFIDNTKMLIDPTGNEIQYIDESGFKSNYTITGYPNHFRSYMTKNLLTAGETLSQSNQQPDEFPLLYSWLRTQSAICLLMSDGSLQLNFFADHSKIIISSRTKAVTFIDKNQVPHTYKIQHLSEIGCSQELRKRLKYAKQMIDIFLNSGNNDVMEHSATETIINYYTVVEQCTTTTANESN